MIKLGRKVYHPELGTGHVVGIRRGHRPYAAMFRNPLGGWIERRLTREEIERSFCPTMRARRKKQAKRREEIKPINHELLRIARMKYDNN